MTFHYSRHSAVTFAIAGGSDLYTVSKILGHGSMKSTEVYAKVDLKNKVDSVGFVNRIVLKES
ncbi:MAG: tyrosine-type recombinase/integrase [Bacteroides sp.]|nr:tyrosine-type recombinase/integrase [Bacteroides sp.]MCM1421753.1 tyrosine-type recombinase/integrase [Bacteroides sp.]